MFKHRNQLTSFYLKTENAVSLKRRLQRKQQLLQVMIFGTVHELWVTREHTKWWKNGRENPEMGGKTPGDVTTREVMAN